ncbi:DUF1330 domain-containing protein [Tritonibacter mobilis]|jgi:uncharacterized protein (DUF1330 family)|uniref:DUF1330 domain-containing protein n=1 Tax=Tritonibacter mobilis TaxID=379347 RepID=UPI0001B8AF25|nr:DUF1330 domain-containing protein [Tritonibacter mobilis]EEW57676.1 conserved hypothetical protein [Ruegeria sp. TrichCH4B]NKX37249.1 DUF1330 domain-containing protein [Rhodobacteraceae bacterium R_SAG4]GLP88762.1 hypothetical protein GCM10007921_43250 [Tritonibacter mobilis]SDX39107.1 Uncharacterized conserved protein, DUF1330 family [Tritonibacter mobilis]
MAKGYWVAHVDIDDMERYKAYIDANAVPFREYGARFLVRGGTKEVREGQMRARTVVIEFEDFTTAKACYDSVAYQQAKALRDPVSTGDMEIIEGYDG